MDEYVAGLWWNKISAQLTWSSTKGTVRSAEYRGPSWSWLSLEGGIYMPKFDSGTVQVSLIDKVEHEIDYKTEDRYSRSN
jgi:hypothetical protein